MSINLAHEVCWVEFDGPLESHFWAKLTHGKAHGPLGCPEQYLHTAKPHGTCVGLAWWPSGTWEFHEHQPSPWGVLG